MGPCRLAVGRVLLEKAQQTERARGSEGAGRAQQGKRGGGELRGAAARSKAHRPRGGRRW